MTTHPALAQDDPIMDEFYRRRDAYDAAYTAGRLDDAERLARDLLQYAERNGGRPYFRQLSRQDLGDVLRRQGDLTEARTYLDEALEIADEEWGQDEDYAQIVYLIALWHDDNGDDPAALATIERGIRILHGQPEEKQSRLWYFHKLRGQLLYEMGRLEEAAAEFEQTAQIAEERYGQDYDYAEILYFRSKVAADRGDQETASDFSEQACEVLLAQDPERQGRFFELAVYSAKLLNELGYTDDAIPRLKQALDFGRRQYGDDSPELFPAYRELLDAYWGYEDVSPVRELLPKLEQYVGKVFPDGSLERFTVDVHRGALLVYDGNLAEAKDLLGRVRTRMEAAGETGNIEYLLCMEHLGTSVALVESPEAAGSIYREAVAAAEQHDLLDTFRGTSLLREYGFNLHQRARQHEAQAVLRRASDLVRKRFGEDSWDYAWCLNYLAETHRILGDFATAERMMRQAHDTMVEAVGEETVEVARISRDLANVYYSMGRYEDARVWAERSLGLNAKVLGEQSEEWSIAAADVSACLARLGRVAEGEQLFERVRALWKQINYNDAGIYVGEWASIYLEDGRSEDALRLARQSLEEGRAFFGYDHLNHAFAIAIIAKATADLGDDEAAIKSLDEAIDMFDRFEASPGDRAEALTERARLLLRTDRVREASSDLRRAMDLAEEQRRLVGDERQRAKTFTEYAGAFELMAACQFRLQDPVEGWQAMERSRARSLFDEMAMSGVDLEIGLDASQRQAVQQRRADAELRVREAETRLNQVRSSGAEAVAAAREELREAREALYAESMRSLSGNQVYRSLISSEAAIPRLSQVQRELGSGVALLSYLIGEEQSFVVAISEAGVQMHELIVDAAAAASLGVEAGPLTRDKLDAVLLGESGSGVLPQIARRGDERGIAERLATLYPLLVPQEVRDAAGRLARLVVIPDGRLALLPFESLVVARGVAPRYFVDSGPPVVYVPSATVLFDLLRRTASPVRSQGGGLLTVGDPAYGTAAGKPGETRAAAALPSLPYSGLESQWTDDAFTTAGLESLRLTGSAATEEVVRKGVAGRSVVHLACHGIADNQFGNFFGALAVSLRPNAPSWDDGYLRLPEIYALDLKQCELAVLSACDTNLGEEQRGEGVWTISRGFLVAGAKRVVASNWIVDDQAGARLTAEFLRQVAESMSKGESGVDYAASLQQAKRRLRGDRNYSHPYYWANFVLVGPD